MKQPDEIRREFEYHYPGDFPEIDTVGALRAVELASDIRQAVLANLPSRDRDPRP